MHELKLRPIKMFDDFKAVVSINEIDEIYADTILDTLGVKMDKDIAAGRDILKTERRKPVRSDQEYLVRSVCFERWQKTSDNQSKVTT